MRPLVVLLLVLGSLAALVVALTTLSDSGRHGDEARGLAPDATTPQSADSSSDLVEPASVPDEARAQSGSSSTETARQAMPAAQDPKGPKRAFGSIEGHVVDEEGEPIADAQVSLFDARPSPLGEEVWLLRGLDQPRALQQVKTEPTGRFVFEQLDPRKDWSLSVTHPNYEHWTSQVAIPVPEGGVYPETVILKPGSSLKGFVRDAATKQPLAGVLLIAENPFALTRPKNKRTMGRLEAKTDATGAYVFPNLGAAPAQARVMSLSAPGYATQVHNNFSMVEYSQPSMVIVNNKREPVRTIGRVHDFELEPGRVIAGRVIGPDQGGMSGIEIEAVNSTGAVGSSGETRSGKNGEFLIEGLAEGIYTLRVTATDYDAAPLQRIESGNTNVVIELFELAVVAGTVVDEDGRPLSSFVVKARASNEISPAYGAVVAQKSVKDAEGRFEISGIPEGSYVVEGVAEGYASCFSEPFTATQGLVSSDLVVRMTRGGTLRGRVMDAYGSAPIAGAEVTTHENDWVDAEFWDLFGALEPSAMTKAKVFTNDKGEFTVEVMTPGVYQVQIRAQGFAPEAVRDVQILDGQETELAAQPLIKGATIVGIVYGRDSSGAPGSTVQLTPADLNQMQGNRQTRSDGTGRFSIESVQPGTYTLTATRPTGGSANPFEALADMKASEVTLTIEDGGRYEIELHLGARRGN